MENKPVIQNQIVQVIQEHGLDTSKTEQIINNFKDFFEIAKEWEIKAKAIKVTRIDQIAEMKMAGEGRKFLKKKRVEIEKIRKKLKEESLRTGKAIDGVANVLKAVLVPIEEYLKEQETYAERIETERKQKLENERLSLLEPYNIDASFYDLKNMPEQDFLNLLDICKRKLEEKEMEEKRLKEEEERKRKELEKQRKEKERKRKEELRKIKEEKEKLARELEKQRRERVAELEKLKKEEERKRKEEKEKLARELEKQRREDAKIVENSNIFVLEDIDIPTKNISMRVNDGLLSIELRNQLVTTSITLNPQDFITIIKDMLYGLSNKK